MTVCSYHVTYALQSESTFCTFESRCSHLSFRFRACFEQGVLDIQATIECGFTLRRVRDMIRTYSFRFLFQKPSNFYSEKKSCSLNIVVLEFQKYRKKWLSIFVKSLKNKYGNDLFHMNFSVFFYFHLFQWRGFAKMWKYHTPN